MRAPAALALLALMLAGCADVRGPPPGAMVVEAPAWSAGRWWNYTIETEGGATLGWINHTVVVERAVANVSRRAWEMQTLRFDRGDVDHDGQADQIVVRDVLYDAATLNIVWNVCHVREPFFGACQGSDPQLDFPLWNGKRWPSDSGGDVIIEHENRAFRATHDGRAAWQVERHAQGVTWPPQVDLYDPGAGFYRERSHPGFASEVWRLLAWG